MVLIFAAIAAVICVAGVGVFLIAHQYRPADLRHQCYNKIAGLASPITVSFSSGTDIAVIQKIAAAVRTQDGVETVEVTSANDARQTFVKQQETQGNQTVLDALNELSGNPLDSTLQANVKSEEVSSTLAFISAESDKYGVKPDGTSTMESLKQATLRGILSAPDSASSTQLFESCITSTSTVFSPTTY